MRSRAASGSIAQALVEEGVASGEGSRARSRCATRCRWSTSRSRGSTRRGADGAAARARARGCRFPTRSRTALCAVAVADPGNIHGIDELRLATRHPLDLGVASRDDILVEIKRMVRAAEAFGARAVLEEAQDLDAEPEEEEGDDLEADDGISDAPLVRLVNSVIFQAAEDGASDVHFEPQEDALVVRFRVDGVLQEVQRIPKRMTAGVTTRLKVLAKLDIAERRKPQDGRISLNAAAPGACSTSASRPCRPSRARRSSCASSTSRSARRRSRSSASPTRCATGSRRSSSRPTGALLVTGPTGSGKSTTLYACLTAINRPEVNIITVEDPVEYRLAGVNQVQINNRAGLTFASALRSILRSDPDVVMVGEIRDGETAKISIEAALTGHFVLSTLHTNDAPRRDHAPERDGRRAVPDRRGRVGRARAAARAQALLALLRDVPALRRGAAVVARLARTSRALDGMVFYRKRGCPRCNQTGYKGRIGIYQLLTMTRRSRSSPSRARAARRSSGPRSRRHADALGRRAREGRRRPHVDRRARARPRLRSAECPKPRTTCRTHRAEPDHQRLDRLGDEASSPARVREVYGPGCRVCRLRAPLRSG